MLMKKFITLKRVAMTLFVALTCFTQVSAKASFCGHSAIYANSTWYHCGTYLAWCSGGAFNGADLGVISSLSLGGQSQNYEDNGSGGGVNWNGGSVTMHYRIDGVGDNTITLDYWKFEGNNNFFQSGGKGDFTTTDIDISGLSGGKHTIEVWFWTDDAWDSNDSKNYKATFITTPYSVSGTISASGWNTFSSNYNLDLSSVTNGKAFVASAASGSTVTLTSVEDKIVAAGTGLMIKGSPDATFTIDVTEDAATFSGTNKLVGLPDGGTVAKNSNNYVFGWTNAAEPGFYYIDNTEPTLAAGKSYLHTDSPLSARLFIDFEENGDVTGIANVNSNKEFNGDFYNLNGQKVQNPTKGLYIVNGKKAIIK